MDWALCQILGGRGEKGQEDKPGSRLRGLSLPRPIKAAGRRNGGSALGAVG